MFTDEDVETHTTPTDLDRCPVQLKRGAFQLRFQVSCHTKSDHANEARVSPPTSNNSNAVKPDRFIPAQMLLTSDFRTLIEEFLVANKDALCMRSFRVLAVEDGDSNVMSFEIVPDRHEVESDMRALAWLDHITVHYRTADLVDEDGSEAMSKYFLSSHRLGIGLRLRILNILSSAIEVYMIERYGDLFDGARMLKSTISEKVTDNLVNSLDVVMKHSEKRVDKVFEAQKKILERSLPMRKNQAKPSDKAFMKEVLQTSAKLRLAKRYRRKKLIIPHAVSKSTLSICSKALEEAFRSAPLPERSESPETEMVDLTIEESEAACDSAADVKDCDAAIEYASDDGSYTTSDAASDRDSDYEP